MGPKMNIVEVTLNNISQHPQAVCFINPKHELYAKKIEWLKEQFVNGLKIKLLYLEGEKSPIGFIEYVPGEYCWRSVDARGYMFIHCIWINGKKNQHQGLGALLIEEVEKEAKDMRGVAVVASDESFMANKELFIKNGFGIVSESGSEQLLAKSFNEGAPPSINNWENELRLNQGLTMVYSKQCPWVARFIEEIKPILQEKNLKPRMVELKSAAEAQKAPSLYGVFSLMHDEKLLADRYISTTRFLNIVKKEFNS